MSVQKVYIYKQFNGKIIKDFDHECSQCETI